MPSEYGEDAITAEIFSRIAPRHRFAVDIGAADGVHKSNTHRLFDAGWAGLCVEGDGDRFAQMAVSYRQASAVRLLRAFVTPINVASMFAACDVPKDFDFLSLDIDGYDQFVLEQILGSYRPAAFVSEINEKIPPPVKFTVKWDPGYRWSNDHFYGHSLAQVESLCRRFDYDMIRVEYCNVFCVAREVNPGFEALGAKELYHQGYLDRPDRKQKFPWNADMEALHTMQPAEQVEFINRCFARHAGKYLCEVGE
jgi:hypothetical protein